MAQNLEVGGAHRGKKGKPDKGGTLPVSIRVKLKSKQAPTKERKEAVGDRTL